ncbi:MAG: hypothetical protein WC058_02710 [Phycisphaeraceae bacterium]
MKAQASWHILGSVKGYRTLGCSPDVSDSDRQALETLGFGQTDDPQFLDSLSTDPAGMGRPLPSGRYAVTRCFEGSRDTAGRRTFRFVSLIFSSHDWINIVATSVQSLMRTNTVWQINVENTASAVQIDVPQPRAHVGSSQQVLPLLDAYLTGDLQKYLYAFPHSSPTAAAVATVPALLPITQRSRVAWGLRILAASAPVQIATYAEVATRSGRKQIVQPPQRSANHPYVDALATVWASRDAPPCEFANACKDVSHIRQTRFVENGSDGEAGHHGRSHLLRPVLWATCIVAFAGGVAITGFLLNVRHTNARDPDPLAELVAEGNTKADWTTDSIQQWMQQVREAKVPAAQLAPLYASAQRVNDAVKRADVWLNKAHELLAKLEQHHDHVLPVELYKNATELVKQAEQLDLAPASENTSFSQLINAKQRQVDVTNKSLESRLDADTARCKEVTSQYWKAKEDQLKSVVQSLGTELSGDQGTESVQIGGGINGGPNQSTVQLPEPNAKEVEACQQRVEMYAERINMADALAKVTDDLKTQRENLKKAQQQELEKFNKQWSEQADKLKNTESENSSLKDKLAKLTKEVEKLKNKDQTSKEDKKDKGN